MQQLYFNNVSTQFRGSPVMPQEVATFNTLSAVLGPSGFNVGALEEETSVNLSAGFVWTAGDNFTITTDLYYINIEDRIVLSGQFAAESEDAMGGMCVPGANPGDPGFCPIKDILDQFPGVNSAQFFTNSIDTETTGIDIVADWAKDLSGGGLFKLSAGFNFNSTELDGTPTVPQTLIDAIGEQAATDTLYSRQEIIWMEDGQPDQHHVLSASYNLNKFTVTGIGNYFGEVKSTESDSRACNDSTSEDFPCEDQTFGGAFLMDLVFDYEVAESTTFTIGVNNLFDKTPDANQFGNNSGIFPFSRRTTPFGFNGGYYYMAVNMSFGNGT
jgi:iron complex outermembrane receptor protein